MTAKSKRKKELFDRFEQGNQKASKTANQLFEEEEDNLSTK
jgi:hypothetical protein